MGKALEHITQGDSVLYLSPSQVFHQRLKSVAHVVNVDPTKMQTFFTSLLTIALEGLGLCIYMTHDDLYEPLQVLK